MSRRVLVRAISFIAFALIMSFVMNFENARRIKRYEEVISDNYYYAFSEIVSGMTKIDYALEKCAYSGDSSMIATLCNEVFCQAETATRAMSRLPIGELALNNTTEFISKTGDFAYSLSKKAAHGIEITEDEKKSLLKLSEGANDIVTELHRISNRLEKDKLDIASIDYTNEEDRTIKDIKRLEREFSEYPVLIYDGPFSDETEGGSEYLQSLAPLSDNELKVRAAAFLGVEEATLSKEGERVEGKAELVSFSDGNVYIDITKRGGLIFRSISQKTAGEKQLSIEEGLERARMFMKKNGFASFEETYYVCYDGSLVVNFAAKESDATVYPELVKITVSLSDGSVINFDAAGYIKNHKERTLPDISGEREKASVRVSKALKILSYSPAVIPDDGTGEILVHEFKCETKNGEHCIVYINAETLFEERILILIEDENGTLVM